MRKALLLFALLIGVLVACQKSSETLNHPTTYRVDGITDLTMGGDLGSAVFASYAVNYVGPIQETVTLSFEGLPSGIEVDDSNANVTTGIPNFQGYIRLVKKDTMDMKGTYNIKLVCTGSKTGKKWYELKLTILAKTKINPPMPTTCDSQFVGQWDTCYDFCDASGTMFTNMITLDPVVPNRIHFSNFQNAGIDVYADLNCTADTFVIPHQTFTTPVGDAALWGSGAWFSDKAIYYNVTDSTAFGIGNCTGTLSRP